MRGTTPETRTEYARGFEQKQYRQSEDDVHALKSRLQALTAPLYGNGLK
jgi:hypothetical protein